jgi:ligand-binding sensor domain-containing protein
LQIVLILLAVIIVPLPASSQINETRFEHISLERGLSQTTVFSIFQDRKGFLWFGTLDGLNKYDGYTYTVYRSDPRNPKTISNNSVFKIFEDNAGALWIGTLGGGLNRFDRSTGEFKRFRHHPDDTTSLSNDFVRSIFQDRAGRLWIGTNNGLNLYDAATETFTQFLHSGNINSLTNNYIWAIHESSSEPGILWIGTYDGLNKFDTRLKIFHAFHSNPADDHSLSNNYIWSIVDATDSTLWIGTNKGLNLFNKRSEKSVRFFALKNGSSVIAATMSGRYVPTGKALSMSGRWEMDWTELRPSRPDTMVECRRCTTNMIRQIRIV